MNGKMGLIIGLIAGAFYLLIGDEKAGASIPDKKDDEKPEEIKPEVKPVKIETVNYGVRGLDNNNPMNIIDSNINWNGMLDPLNDGDTKFCVFISPDYGIRAGTKILNTYYFKHNLKTVSEIINRYAPGHENDTEKYIQFVSDKIGVEPDAVLSFPNDMQSLVTAIIFYENGMNPYNISYIKKGIEMS